MYPGPPRTIGRLKGSNFTIPLQRQRDLVEALQQALAAARINLEGVPLSGWRYDRLRLEIDADLARALRRLDVGRERVDDLFLNHDRKNSVLKAIGEEDIAKTRADDGADSHLLQRPDRPLARRTTSEIRAGHENL